ncbi:unnamed protein product [Lasius platythorax]|uniref:Uncharacterized protein n=1 Tax=Lasius platythorax TaxID=488582 RepID=A0AAV2N1Q4_9HYME
MSRYCDPLQAAESCISSSMFPLPVSLPILSIPVPLGCSCIDCVPALLVPCIRPHVSISAYASGTMYLRVLYPKCIPTRLLAASTDPTVQGGKQIMMLELSPTELSPRRNHVGLLIMALRVSSCLLDLQLSYGCCWKRNLRFRI